MPFVDVPFDIDPDTVVDAAVAYLQGVYPGWELSDGQVEAHLIEALARITVETGQVAAQVPAAVFAAFATRFLTITQDPGAEAAMASTWTMVDASGYTLPAGTVVAHRTSGDTALLFAPAAEVTIPPGAPRLPAPRHRRAAPPRARWARRAGWCWNWSTPSPT